jgi:hypothetical protein
MITTVRRCRRAALGFGRVVTVVGGPVVLVAVVAVLGVASSSA